MDKKYIISTLVIILLMGVSVYAAPTSRIERTILPESDSTYNLGSNAVRWANIYGDTLYGDGSNLTGVSGWATSSSDYWLTIQDTADLTEGTNLYYTQARVWDDTWASTTLDTLLTNSQTAYAWGDHGIAGYASSTGMYAKYGTLADLQLAVSDDFHNLGGTDANTTYTAGTNITLTGTQFDVDDAFLKNNASDTTTGGITMLSGTTTSSFYIGNDLTVSGDTTIVDLYLTNEIVSGYTTTTLGLFTQANGHIGGNLTVDGTGHDSFSDFVANEHLDWTASVGTIHSDNYTNTTYTAGDFAHNSLSGLNDGDSYEHLTATQVAALHAESHNIASHSDTTATGAELDDLTDNSMVDTLHRHSELSASDGTPDRALVVNASGYVGIGTTAPNHKLEVVGASTDFGVDVSGSYPVLRPGGAGAEDIELSAIGNGGNVYIRAPGTDATQSYISLYATGAERMRIQNDGNVGIGTTAPTSKLTVNNNGYSTPTATYHTASTISFEGAQIELAGGTLNASPWTYWLQVRAWNSTTPPISLQPVGGNVGIGNTSPLGKLIVKGAGTGTGIGFQTQNSSGTALVTMLDNGNVGIGTTTPSQKLDVAGNVRADDYLEYSRPIPKGEALPIIMNMKNKEDGTLDHKSFPSFTSKEIEISEVKDKEGKVVKEAKIITKESVSLSSQIKYLIKGMQEQQETIEELKIRIEELESSKKVMGVGDSCSPCEDLNWRQEFINWIKSYPLDN